MSSNNELAEKYAAAQIPRRFWEASKDDLLDDKDSYSQILRYSQKSKKVFVEGINLLFYGPRNSGKTFFACLLLKDLLSKGFSAAYTTMAEVTTMMMQPTPGQVFHREIVSPDFYMVDCVDDLNEGNKTALKRLISRRRDEAKPLIVSTVFDCSGDTDNFLEAALKDDYLRFTDLCVKVSCKTDPFKVARKYRAMSKALKI